MGFQVVGIVLALLGLAAIGDRLNVAAEAVAGQAAEVGDRIAKWRRAARALGARLRQWWARRRGRSVSVHLSGTTSGEAFGVGDLATAIVTRARVDRSTITDRAWLAYLDDRVHGALDDLDALRDARQEDRENFERRLSTERRALRAEITRETTGAWQAHDLRPHRNAVGLVVDDLVNAGVDIEWVSVSERHEVHRVADRMTKAAKTQVLIEPAWRPSESGQRPPLPPGYQPPPMLPDDDIPF